MYLFYIFLFLSISLPPSFSWMFFMPSYWSTRTLQHDNSMWSGRGEDLSKYLHSWLILNKCHIIPGCDTLQESAPHAVESSDSIDITIDGHCCSGNLCNQIKPPQPTVSFGCPAGKRQGCFKYNFVLKNERASRIFFAKRPWRLSIY